MIRPGVTVVSQGRKADNPGCTSNNASVCPTFEAMIVSDVDRDGDRVAVLRISGGEQAILFLSEDLGATWKEIVIDTGLTADLLWDQQGLGVHVFGGEVYLLLSRSRIGAGGGTYPELWPLRVDLAAGSVTAAGPQSPSVAFPQKRPNGRLRAMSGDGDFRSGETWPTEIDWDPISGESTTTGRLGCTGLPCRPTLWASADNGASFEGFTPIEGATEVCRVHWGEGDGAVTPGCVSRGQWPQPDTSQRAHIIFRGSVPFNTWTVGEDAVAAGITLGTSPQVTALVPLGRGKVGEFKMGRMGRPRFGAPLLLDDPTPPKEGFATGRLVELTPTGAQELVFRQTPCVSDTFCGYGGGPTFGYRLLQWLEPLGGGEYLAFWTVQSEANDNQQTLYVSRERPTLKEVTSGGLDAGSGTSPIPAYPEAHPMTPLEKMCARQASCPPYTTTFQACVAAWTVEDDFLPGTARARELFLATPPGCGFSNSYCVQCRVAGGTCADLDGGSGTVGSTLCSPLVANPDYQQCSRCIAGSAVICLGNAAGNVGQLKTRCEDFGLTCNQSTSSAVGGCGRSPRCTGLAGRCEAGVSVGCDPDMGREVRSRCDLLGAQCSAAGCSDGTGAGRSACANFAPRCEGSYLVGCGSGRIHYVDCTELGFAGCSAGHCT